MNRDTNDKISRECHIQRSHPSSGTKKKSSYTSTYLYIRLVVPMAANTFSLFVDRYILTDSSLVKMLYFLQHPLKRIKCNYARQKKQSKIEEKVLECRGIKFKNSLSWGRGRLVLSPYTYIGIGTS